MGQGLYRMLGWGCLNPPEIDWDSDIGIMLFDVLKTSYEAKPNYLILPVAVDDAFLQQDLNLPPLPTGGLPHIEPRTAVEAAQCNWWPDVGTKGVWISHRVTWLWSLLRVCLKPHNVELPKGQPIFVSDFD